MWILRQTLRFVPPCLRLRRANSPPDCLLTLLSPRPFAFDLDPGAVDQQVQRAAALERLVVGGPVPGLVGRGCRSAHAFQLPRWIHKMNPSRGLCNRAGGKGKIHAGYRHRQQTQTELRLTAPPAEAQHEPQGRHRSRSPCQNLPSVHGCASEHSEARAPMPSTSTVTVTAPAVWKVRVKGKLSPFFRACVRPISMA